MPYYVYIPDKNGDWIQRGPYFSSRKAESKKDRMEDQTGRSVEIRSWPTWQASVARKNFADEEVDRVGVDKGTRRFSSAKGFPKEADIRPR